MPQFNYEQARFNMVEQQIRPWEVLNQSVLDVMAEVPREKFVPAEYQALAFADVEIPLGHDQVMMFPRLEARLLQSLSIKPTDRVLEIGTGSGYLTALLAKLAEHVDSVDIHEDFIKQAEKKLAGFDNVSLSVGNAAQGWKTDIQYDVIVLTGSIPVLSSHFKAQLKPNGRLFAIVGQDPIMEALVVTRYSDTEWQVDSLFETSVAELEGVAQPAQFVL
ncbi:protein-L-isoaspartate O-methyltransferase [Candidatus Albibeggiatoa sp. nov. NOAA]|uniref:protein-L-isoaspartate O-methyltransferase family protein n=1 Tax=Candidatus Albibeggiatoa sp. nov. NOAA TaxID=3162724 RepID=UPI0033005F0D|nr:protein-L-isoaspartate O-methyltransferase [Thiotrichaceae bacterium]